MHHHADLRAATHEAAHICVARCFRWQIGRTSLQKIECAPPQDEADMAHLALILCAGDVATGAPKLVRGQMIRLITAIEDGQTGQLPKRIYSRDAIGAMREVLKLHSLDTSYGDLVDSYRALRKESRRLCKLLAPAIEAEARSLAKAARWAQY